MLKLFHKEVKGHGQGHMFKIYSTIEKVLSWGTHAKYEPLISYSKMLWLILKFVIDRRANWWADGQSDYYGYSLSGGPKPKLLYTPFNSLT